VTTPADRLEELLKPTQNLVTGIDFVYVSPSQTTLDVFFLRPPGTLSVPLTNLAQSAVRIYSPSGGERHAEVPVTGIAWVTAFGRDVLHITTAYPGDFSRYRLHIDDPRVDRFYNDVWFSFKANCPSDFDCKPPDHECPPDSVVDFPVDYTARDFWSFRRALLDFAAQRYPIWQDRLEADVGVMFAEAMSALGDEFAYYQDRVGREGYLATATQRRSLRRLASLVDYHIHDGLGASTWLDFEVNPGATVIPAGTQVSDARGRITFEVGRGIDESLVPNPPTPTPIPAPPPPLPKQYPVSADINRMPAYQWDVGDVCLPVGATELFVLRNHAANLLLDDTPPGKDPGKWVLLKTNPVNPAVRARAWMVRIIAREDLSDPVLPFKPSPSAPLIPPPIAVTRLQWESAQATPFELDLATLEVHGNMLPATAGELKSALFMIGPSDDEVNHPAAIERTGPNQSIAYLFSLPGSDEDELVWEGATPIEARPAIRLTSWTLAPDPSHPPNLVWIPDQNSPWSWARSLIGVNSAEPADPVFALDDGTWRRVVGYRRIAGDVVHRDYAADRGKTIRFGDGEFGLVPTPPGTLFQVHYRLGGGAKGNVPAGTLTNCRSTLVSTLVKSVTNPLPVTDGVDPEAPAQIRQLAPEAFRAVTYRAVRQEDYAEAAERLPWVQNAGAAFRWTGSWLDAFVTPDPLGAFEVAPERRVQLEDQLERFRQAGRPAYMLDPVYADLDLTIAVCVEPHGFRGEVEEQVLIALFGKGGIRPRVGFFSPDNFTFGQPLERSRVEAVIQDVAGVRAVEDMSIRRRGWFPWRAFSELTYRVGDNELVRVENNPLAPGHGSVRLEMRGGA
jgi:hypothetical protein